MSAATVSSTDLATVFVRLLGEGTDVWRPVEAVRLGETTYRLADSAAPEDETWIFQPGDIVVVERRRSDDGLIAVALATQLDEPSWALRRKAG